MASLILVRGLPGSGKSTIAQKLAQGVGIHLETDMYFIEDGEYRFDASKLNVAHAWCQATAFTWLAEGARVVVSNTFTTVKELRPYFELGKEFGILPNVVHAQGHFKSIHNVPEDVILKMRERFQIDISELYEEFH